MVVVETALELAGHAGRSPGVTEGTEITQARVDGFAELSGYNHWIHVGAAHATHEQPGGKTIAHGLYLLSLIPPQQRRLFRIGRRGAGPRRPGAGRLRRPGAHPKGSSADRC